MCPNGVQLLRQIRPCQSILIFAGKNLVRADGLLEQTKCAPHLSDNKCNTELLPRLLNGVRVRVALRRVHQEAKTTLNAMLHDKPHRGGLGTNRNVSDTLENNGMKFPV